MASREVRVGIVGATGAVGRVMREVLLERDFPVGELRLFASERSAGAGIEFRGETLPVESAEGVSSFRGLDLVLFSAGTSISRELAPMAVEAGAIVVDNSNAWRMEGRVPLVVPEVNPGALDRHQGLIANPNCSTIQMVVALKPLHDAARLERVVVSTYQSVSGTGLAAVEELEAQSRGALGDGPAIPPTVYPHPIAFDLLPEIDVFDEDGHSIEELKMVHETRKILGEPGLQIAATCVRVPVRIGHAESVNAIFERVLTPAEARERLAAFPGVVVVDAPREHRYPRPGAAAGRDEVFVGRIRSDTSHPRGLNMWVVADNLRKGAATNAVQIAELLFDRARRQPA